MSRRAFVFRNGQLVDAATAPPLHPKHGRAPAIRPDGMSAIRSMADGRMYDGKSAYYDSVRRAGCEIVGNDRKPFERRPTHEDAGIGVGVREDMRAAIAQLESQG